MRNLHQQLYFLHAEHITQTRATEPSRAIKMNINPLTCLPTALVRDHDWLLHCGLLSTHSGTMQYHLQAQYRRSDSPAPWAVELQNAFLELDGSSSIVAVPDSNDIHAEEVIQSGQTTPRASTPTSRGVSSSASEPLYTIPLADNGTAVIFEPFHHIPAQQPAVPSQIAISQADCIAQNALEPCCPASPELATRSFSSPASARISETDSESDYSSLHSTDETRSLHDLPASDSSRCSSNSGVNDPATTILDLDHKARDAALQRQVDEATRWIAVRQHHKQQFLRNQKRLDKAMDRMRAVWKQESLDRLMEERLVPDCCPRCRMQWVRA